MGLGLDDGNDIYYTEQYKNIIRSCKELLLERSKKLPITNLALQNAHSENFHKYLKVLQINPELIWTISYLNDITDPFKDFFPMSEIITIDKEIIEDLIKSLKTRHEN